MSLITEEERERLSNMSVQELKEAGYKHAENLKAALRKDRFWVLTEHGPRETAEILKIPYKTVLDYRKHWQQTVVEELQEFAKKIGHYLSPQELIEAGRHDLIAATKDIMKVEFSKEKSRSIKRFEDSITYKILEALRKSFNHRWN